MAGRPQKEGLEFAGWDTNVFDGVSGNEVDKLIETQGHTGFVVYMFLCQRAYGSHGYYYPWRFDDAATTAKKVGGGAGAKAVEQTVRFCLRIGLFDEKLFDKWKILTSRRIQKTYKDVALRRTNKSVLAEFWLLTAEESAGLVLRSQFADFGRENANFPDSRVKNRGEQDRAGEGSGAENRLEFGDISEVSNRCGGMLTTTTWDYSRNDTAGSAEQFSLYGGAGPQVFGDEEALAFVLKEFETALGRCPGPSQARMMRQYLASGMSADLVAAAIHEADEPAKQNWKYINTILKRWQSAGLFSLEDLALDKAAWENRKKVGNVGKKTVETAKERKQRLYDEALREGTEDWDG